MSKFYVTTALPYVNAPPHIGFALEAIQADVIARQNRLEGKDVYFLSGTDEHGAKIMRVAEQAGIEVQRLVDENTKKFKQLLTVLSISNDNFIRTSDKARHFPGAQTLWKKIAEKGDFYKATYKGFYCVGHEAFITEKDMENWKCKDHGIAPEELEEENYYFRLSKYNQQIQEAFESGKVIIYPDSRRNEVLSLLKSGLRDVSFSRPSKDISWGIPVPGDPAQTMYVWCDALSNYISALGFGSDDKRDFEKYWPADMHVIGKDILRFHAVIWLGMLLSAGLELPKSIFVHGFINLGGKKMSKTIGNVVDPFDIAERFGADALRFYMLHEVQPFEDHEFTEEKFVEVYNGNLANGLGNYISRVAKMVEMYFAGVIEKPSDDTRSSVPFKISSELLKSQAVDDGSIESFTVLFSIENYVLPRYTEAVHSFQFSRALDAVWGLISDLDGYIQLYEPFKLVKTDQEKTRAVLWEAVYGACAFADMLRPFLPDTAEKIFKIFGSTPDKYKDADLFRVTAHEALFPRE